MNENKNATIIGGGIGGLTTAIYLSRNGFDVTLFEKNAFPGGRCGQMDLDGHRFDVGATLLMMPDSYRSVFADFGKNLEEELDLIRMDPIYKLKFHNQKELVFTSDMVKMKEQLEAVEPGSFLKFLEYMAKSYRIFKLSMDFIIEKNFYNPFDFFNLRSLFILPRVKAFKNHYKQTARYFKSEMIRTILTFQNIYVGQNPFNAPGVFAMLPFVEINDGVFFPRGGMGKIVESLVSIALENGVKINYNSSVRKIQVENNRVTRILFEDDSFYKTDLVIATADLPYVYNKLLPESRYTRRINRLKYACSVVVFHWAVDTIYPELEQHTVFVSEDYRKGISSVFNGKGLPADPCFYVHSPARTDASAAPEGEDSITVLIPVPHLGSSDNPEPENMKEFARKAVLNRFAIEGIKDFEKHIKFERCYVQDSWKSIFNVMHGSVFGSLSHDIFQMGYMRPHNRHDKIKNLYFAGGSTHPGNGVPMVLLSAKLTSEKIIKQIG